MRLSLLVALGAVVLISACGPAPLEPRDPTPGAPHFKVATFNVEYRSAGDAETVAAVGAGGVDVVFLQEVTPAWERVLRDEYAADYPYMLFEPDGGTSGLGVLSRFPLTDLGVHAGPGGWHPAWHVVAHLHRVELQVLNVHLRSLLSGNDGAVGSYLTSDDDHRREVSDFADACSQGYSTIVLGDFNEGPDGGAVASLEARGFENALPAFRPGQPTWRHSSVGNQLEETIDHILFDDSLRPLNAWVERRGNSDHWPVLAHLEPYEW